MNIALEKTQEFVEGKMRRNYGDAFVRGNNGMWTDSACSGASTGGADLCVQSCTFPPIHEP